LEKGSKGKNDGKGKKGGKEGTVKDDAGAKGGKAGKKGTAEDKIEKGGKAGKGSLEKGSKGKNEGKGKKGGKESDSLKEDAGAKGGKAAKKDDADKTEKGGKAGKSPLEKGAKGKGKKGGKDGDQTEKGMNGKGKNVEKTEVPADEKKRAPAEKSEIERKRLRKSEEPNADELEKDLEKMMDEYSTYGWDGRDEYNEEKNEQDKKAWEDWEGEEQWDQWEEQNGEEDEENKDPQEQAKEDMVQDPITGCFVVLNSLYSSVYVNSTYTNIIYACQEANATLRRSLTLQSVYADGPGPEQIRGLAVRGPDGKLQRVGILANEKSEYMHICIMTAILRILIIIYMYWCAAVMQAKELSESTKAKVKALSSPSEIPVEDNYHITFAYMCVWRK